jgi:chaperonin GroEL
LVDALRPTLGPGARFVAIGSPVSARHAPELLDDGGAIARYINQLPNPSEDMGAMLTRDLLWRLQQQVGDGTVTAAVIFAKVYNEGVRYLAAGGSPMRLKSSLEDGARTILDELTTMTQEVEGEPALAKLAQSLCRDTELAQYMGEVFDIIGQWGRLEIRKGRSRHIEREYVEGMYWDRGLLSREMYASQSNPRVELDHAAILITDLEIDEPDQLYPVLEMAIREKIPALLIVAQKLSPRVIQFLVANKDKERFQAIAVQTPGSSNEEQAGALQDLAILTGGRPFAGAAGDTLGSVSPQDLGRARRVWADYQHFGIVAGRGDPRALRRHIGELRRAYGHIERVRDRETLQQRIGKLMGGTAVLWVGAATEMDMKARVEVAKRTATAMRVALRGGVLPGGGVALMACRPALQRRLAECTGPDERAAYRILFQAMEEPFRTIASNAGYDASDVMAEVRLAGPGYGMDATCGKIVDIAGAGIYDITVVQKAAVHGALTTAALALTVDVLVHHGAPAQAPLPEPARHKEL